MATAETVLKPDFESKRRHFIFNDEHEQLRESIRKFAQKELAPHAEEWEETTFPDWVFKRMGELGFLGLTYPEQYGGQGGDYFSGLVLGEEIGYGNSGGLTMGIAVHTDMANPPILAFGTEEQKQRYLVPAIKGEKISCLGITEPDAGSDVAGIKTRAVRDGDDWVINGSKLYITNGVQADWLCLLVRTSDEGGFRGMSQVIFPTTTPGFTVSRALRKLGNHSSDTAELSFVDARVPVANTVGSIGRGFQQQMQQFQNERLIASYLAVGQCAAAIERTVDYARQRRAFGKPLVEHQWVQYHLAELSAEVDLLRQYNYAAAEAYVAGEDATRFATVAKLTAGRLGGKIAHTGLPFHGGIGYMGETWTSRFFPVSPLLSIGGGGG